MTHDELAREIEDALSVTPSPQFKARVRSRIAESRRPSAARLPWGLATAGFVLAAIAFASLFPRPQQPASVVPPAGLAATTAAAIVPENPPEIPPKVTTPPQRSVTAKKTAKAEPEILIDPRDAIAFEKFVEGVREDRIDLGKLIELQEAAARRAPIEAIALMPLEKLEPVPGPGFEGGNL